MTNWHDPELEAAESFAFTKLVHALVGLYFWEFLLNLKYEKSILTRKRDFTRAALLYMGCRWATLTTMILQLVGLDASYGINCQAFIFMSLGFSYISYLFATGLIILRVYALWENKRVVILFTSVIYLANIAAYVYTTAKSQGQRIGDLCNLRHTVDTRVSIVSTVATDVVLVALMLFGILRWKGVWNGSIWWLLYTQGLIWVVVITLAHVPSLIFIILNLNDPMNLMFTIPGFVVLSIGASRMHRGLVESAALNVDMVSLDMRSPKTELRFANISRPGDRELDGGDSVAGTVLDSNGLTSGPQLEARQEERSLGSETV